MALEQDSKLEDLADVGFGRLDHASAPVWLDLDQAVALEADQRLADRSLRHAEVGRDPGLDQLRAGRQRAGEDLVAELLVDAALQLGREDSLTHTSGDTSYLVA